MRFLRGRVLIALLAMQRERRSLPQSDASMMHRIRVVPDIRRNYTRIRPVDTYRHPAFFFSTKSVIVHDFVIDIYQ